MKKADWNNTRLVSGLISAEIVNLKQQPGKDIAIFGSSDLSLNFIPNGLIDELRILINPVILGDGKPLFKGLKEKLKLKLLKTKTFNSGNVLLCYEPVSNSQTH
jgi:dihydrofolate reductase